MKSTGIIRRIDDLGRVVVPKEIRRTMRIQEGDPLEIFTDITEGTVSFKKYGTTEVPLDMLEDFKRMIKNDCDIEPHISRGVQEKLKEIETILRNEV